MVKVHCKYSRLLCARESILYLFPLFQSARWYTLLTSKKLHSDDMLFLPDLVIYALEDSFFTRLTKSKETVPGRRPESPLSSVLTSSFISSPGWLDLAKSLSSHSSTEYHPGPVAIYQELLHSSSRYNATVTWKEQALQWIGKGVCTSKTTKNQEAICYRQQISWLDWRHVLCWYIAGLVKRKFCKILNFHIQRILKMFNLWKTVDTRCFNRTYRSSILPCWTLLTQSSQHQPLFDKWLVTLVPLLEAQDPNFCSKRSFFSCIAGLVRDLVGQQREWACDWKQISPKKEANNQPNKTNKQKQHTHTSQGTSQAKWSGKFAN